MSRTALLAVGLAVLLAVGTVGAVALVPGALQAPAAADTDAQSPKTTTNTDTTGSDTITVSASGSASATPDEAIVAVAVRADGNDSATVRGALADRAADLRAALDELNVTYETRRYSIRNVERHRRDGPADAPAFEGEHAFTVTVDDPERVGAVVDAAANASATVDGVRLTLSDERRTELRNDAIANAMADARTQASTIAATANLTLTGVATVDATDGGVRPVAYETAAAGGDAGGAPATSIDGGEVSVEYRVTVTYNATG
jgi:hypothetical protein